MHVVDGPLVDYYQSCVADLRRSGFHGLLLALVREADAPTFYEDLLRYWNSINDVTGHHLVFAVAGGSAAERVGVGAIHGHGAYCEQMALAEPKAFEIGQLRLMAGPRRNVEPLLGNLGDANTAQITALCHHLEVNESDLPCLHVTHLETGTCRVIPLSSAPGTTVYTACKHIVSQLQPAFRLFDAAAYVESTDERRQLNKKISDLEHQLSSAQLSIRHIDQLLSRPYKASERDQLAAYFSRRLVERPDTTPWGIGPIVERCHRADRTPADFQQASAALKQLGLTSRLKPKAYRMLDAAFCDEVIRYDIAHRQKADHDQRRKELTQLVAEIEPQLPELRQQQERFRRQDRITMLCQQEPTRRAIAEAFSSLRPTLPASLQTRWDLFISYAAPDRLAAMEIFHQLENVGPAFMDIFCLLPGQDWQAFLPEIQSRCRFTVALLSRHTATAHFQTSEIHRAINLMRAGKHQIIPIQIEHGVQTPFGLEQVHSFVYCPGDALTPLRRSLDHFGYFSP
jgi:hypothetical protein